MARPPHVDRAILDLNKLANYCLSPAHPRGRHKARVFREALGIGANEAAWLRDALLEGVRTSEATELGKDSFGIRWRVDVAIARQNRRIVVRTLWILQIDEQAPRFVTCWVL